MDPQRLARLAAAGFEAVRAGDRGRHLFLARAPFAAVVELHETTCRIGAAGRITERGLALLVWRAGSPVFAARGFEQAASDEDVGALRAFQRELHEILLDAPQ